MLGDELRALDPEFFRSALGPDAASILHPLQGLVLAITLAVLAANALVDVLTLLVDPRTRAA